MTTTPITSITDELLAEIEYAASHATPGEWSYGEANNKDAYEFGVRNHEWFIADICDDQPNYEADGHHIAISRPQNVLALTTELRRLRAENEALRSIISKTATEIGAHVSTECSLDFMAMLPDEARAVVKDLTLKAEYASNNHMASLMLVADIRAAAGDPDGRLMQPELLTHIEALRVDAARWKAVESAGGTVTLRLHNTRPDGRESVIDTAMQSSTEGN